MERHTLRWVQGDVLRLEVLIEDENGQDLDLTGFTATWKIADRMVPVSLRPTEGIVVLDVPGSVTRQLREGSHELRLIAPDGEATTVLTGSARRADR